MGTLRGPYHPIEDPTNEDTKDDPVTKVLKRDSKENSINEDPKRNTTTKNTQVLDDPQSSGPSVFESLVFLLQSLISCS